MLKALIKKQFLELKQQYTPKKYRSQKRKGGIGFFILYLLAAFSVGFAFVGMGMLLCDTFHQAELDWLYYLIFNLIALAVGVVGSVFGTYSTLYQARDNEQLLAMPIRPIYLLFARMLTVVATTFVFVAIVQIPAFGVHIYVCGTSAAQVIVCLLGLILTCLLASALSCLLGWVVALVAARTRKKTFVTVVLSVLLLALYYFVYFRLNTMLQSLAQNAVTVGEKLSANAYVLKLVGLGYTGHLGGFALYAAVSLLAFALTCWLLQRSFLRIATSQRSAAKAVYVAKRTAQKSVSAALFQKERRRFTQSATYLLNNILGTLIETAACVYLFISFREARTVVSQLLSDMGDVPARLLGMLPGLAAALICAMQPTTAPSISLEGRAIWVLQSMPVKPGQIFSAKQKLCCIVNLPGALLMVCTLSAVMGLDALGWVQNILFALSFIAFISALGLWCNIRKPHLDWTNEAVAIKQGMPVTISIFGGWAAVLLCGLAAYLTRNAFDACPFLFVLPALAAALLNRWIYTKGAEAFETL